MVGLPNKLRALDILSVCLLAVFTCTLGMTFFHQVAFDEVAWFTVSGRTLQNGFRFQHFYYECKSNLTWDIPWVFLPARIFVSLLHPDSYAGFRVMGILVYISLIGVGSIIIKTLFSHLKWLHIVALITALLSLGVLPYTMVSVRPESSVALGILVLYAIFCNAHKIQGRNQTILLAIVFLLIGSWFFSIHPKTVLFAPVIAWMAFLLSGKKRIGFLCAVAVMVMGGQSYSTWQNYLQCEDNPAISARQKTHALNVETLLASPMDGLHIFFDNIKKSELYLEAHLFKSEYYLTGSGGNIRPRIDPYLPFGAFPDTSSGVSNTVIKMVVFFILLAALFAITGSAYNALRYHEKLSNSVLAAAMLCGTVFIFLGLKTSLIEYEVPFVWSVLAISCAVVVMYFYKISMASWWAKVALATIITVAIMSQLHVAYYLWPYIQAQNNPRKTSTLSGLKIHPYPRQYFGDIEAAARDCVVDQGDFNVLFLDEITYLNFYDSQKVLVLRRPVHLINKQMKYINNYKNFAMLLHCTRMPGSLKQYALRNGRICCVTSNMLP